ncbi:MAG: hypothetical protein RJB09_752, partial [Pseudomonadota bacterium]
TCEAQAQEAVSASQVAVNEMINVSFESMILKKDVFAT